MAEPPEVVWSQMLSRLRRPDRVLAVCAGVACVLWIACVGPVRTWASDAGIRQMWVFGVAPGFFAGATFVLWQSLGTGTRAAASVVISVGLSVLAEAAQLFLPGSTADPFDIVAGVAGALLAAPVVWWRTRES